jgi:hypothetical protein
MTAASLGPHNPRGDLVERDQHQIRLLPTWIVPTSSWRPARAEQSGLYYETT